MKNYFKIIFFIVVISIPLIGKVLGLDTSSKASLPPISQQLSKAGDLRGKLNIFIGILFREVAQFNEHFLLRQELFSFQTYLQEEFFSKNVIPNKVVKGQEGWLFLGNGHSNALSESKGFYNFSPTELTDFRELLTSRHNWCKERGIKYYVAIAPNKLSVYGAHLPIPLSKSKTKTEQLLDFKESGLRIIDLKQNFQEYPDLRLFHKTDTHWNDIGAFIAYTTLVNTIKQDFPEIPVLSMFNFKIDTLRRNNKDLARMLNQDMIEEELVLSPKFTYNGQRETSSLSVPTNYFQNPNSYELRYKNTEAPLKVLMFRDSFTEAMSKYIKESFGHTLFIWHREFNYSIIETFQPDIIIDEVVERDIDLLIDNSERYGF